MEKYFFANGNEQRGPYSLDEIAALGLRNDTLVWHEGLIEWRRADSIPELMARMAELQMAAPVAERQTSANNLPNPQSQLNYETHYAVPTDGLAIASLVLGIISIPGLCLWGGGLVPAILAIIFGLIARSRIRRGERTGAGIALAGLILGFIAAGLVVAFFVIAISIGLINAMK